MDRPPLIIPQTWREWITLLGQQRCYLRADLYRSAEQEEFAARREVALAQECDPASWWMEGAADPRFDGAQEPEMLEVLTFVHMIPLPPRYERVPFADVTAFLPAGWTVQLRRWGALEGHDPYDPPEALHYWHAFLKDHEGQVFGQQHRTIDPDWSVDWCLATLRETFAQQQEVGGGSAF